MKKILAATIAAILGLVGVVGLASGATATSAPDLSAYCAAAQGYDGETCDVWVTWRTPNYVPSNPTLGAVGLPQTFVGLGKIDPADCGVTYQQDHYVGPRTAIEAVLADGRLTGSVPYPEDNQVVRDWRFVSSDPCLAPDAWASVHVVPPTCYADGTLGSVELAFATAGATVPVGGAQFEITFTAAPGHRFPAGPRVSADGTTLVVAFEVAKKLADAQCYVPDVTFPEPTPPTCTEGGTLPPTPADTDAYTWSWEGNTLVATATPGTTFASGTTQSRTYTLDGPLPGPSTQCPVVVVPSVTVSDVCGTANDEVVVGTEEGVTYATERTGLEVTVTATTAEGYVFGDLPAGWSPTEDGSAVFTVTLTDAPCPTPRLFQAPTLDGTVVNPVCSLDAPYLQGTVVLDDPDNQSTGHVATITMTDGTNTYAFPSTFPLGAFSVLWPGAAVGPTGHGVAWPGYITNPDGTYTATTGNFAWTRGPNVHVTVSVNPTTTVAVSYPPSSPTCLTDPVQPVSQVLSAPEAVATESAAVLAATGPDDVQTSAWTALLAVVFGSGLVVVAGSRRLRR